MSGEFKDRMKFLVNKLGSIKKLSSAANVSEGVIKNYLSGQTDPTRKKLIALASAGNLNIIWFLTGKGSSEKDFESMDLIKDILVIAEEYLEESGEILSKKQKAELVALSHDYIYGKDYSHEIIRQIIERLIAFAKDKSC
jgi:transcriptional regulator with XRE-family HTH domain